MKRESMDPVAEKYLVIAWVSSMIALFGGSRHMYMSTHAVARWAGIAGFVLVAAGIIAHVKWAFSMIDRATDPKSVESDDEGSQ